MDRYKKILDIINASNGVSIDTRTLKKDQVFFALKGDSFDGNKFVDVAFSKGAKWVIASDEKYNGFPNVIIVDDTLKALQDAARLYREQFDIPVIALTGTNGKTTTKELICKMLSTKYKVLCTSGNFNNHIGVPLTLFKFSKQHEIAVIEMGASSMGEIGFLCNLALPDYGLITSIGIAHIQGFGSKENIVKTKLELYNYLKDNNGLFFYNKSIVELASFIDVSSNVDIFSHDDIHGKYIDNIKIENSFPFIKVVLNDNSGKKIIVKTNLYGQYNFTNIVNAVKLADYFDVDPINIKLALEKYIPKNNRSQFVEWKGNELILDAYNANPSSMKTALDSFKNIETSKGKYLILGDMLELGEMSLQEHKNIVEFLLNNRFYEAVLFIGKEFVKAKNAMNISSEKMFFVEKTEEAKDIFNNLSINNSLLLAKASRGIKAEEIFK